MSNVYVRYEGSAAEGGVNGVSPLPRAECFGDCDLRESRALLFGKTLRTLPAGTRMHVLARVGDWLYVCVPRGDIGWLMDIEGEFGFVKGKKVRLGSSGIQLDWTE